MRVKRGVVARRRRKRILKMASGYTGGRRRLYRSARETVEKGLVYAYAHRRTRKRDFRRLWIARINAAARSRGLKYSTLAAGLRRAQVALDRKVLAEMAIHDPLGFDAVAELARQ